MAAHDLTAHDLKHFIHGFQTRTKFQKAPLLICEADGIYYKDVNGKKYIDGLAGVFVVNVGHNNRLIIEAMKEQLDRVAFAPAIQGTNPRAIELAKLVAEIVPPPLSVVQFSSGGSEAVETGLKIARHYHKATGNPQKIKFISRYNAYHGATMGALSAGGKRKQKASFEPLVPGFIQVHGPHCYRCPFGKEYPACQVTCASIIDEIIELEGPETVAGIIVEPMMRRGGAATPPPEYLPMLREICNRHKALLIFDEIVTGFGRTGRMFAAQTFNTTPDILCLGKGISSGYAPLAATVISEETAAALDSGPVGSTVYMHGYTYGGNPVSCAAGIASIRVLMEQNLVRNSEVMGEYLRQKLEELKPMEVVGSVQGRGLLSGIEFVKNTITKEQFPDQLAFGFMVGDECQKRGLLLRPDVHEMAFSPPLIITKSEIDEMVGIVTESIKAALSKIDG